jgi:hypothetical protein
VGAGPTSTGHLAVFTVRRGLVNPLCPELLSALSVHKEAAKGVRWLGPLPLLVSFSSERSSNGAWRNSLMVTDVHAGHRCDQQHAWHPAGGRAGKGGSLVRSTGSSTYASG